MLPRSSAFDSAIVNGHRTVFKAEVLLGVGGSLATTFLPIDGNVTGDVSNSVRRSCDVRMTDPTGVLIPEFATDLLTPYGNELRLSRGVAYPDGTVEYVPLGVFGIAEVEVRAQQGVLDVTLKGFDRADRVARAKLTDTYTIAAGTAVNTAIQGLISSRVSNLTFNFGPTSSTLPTTTFQPGDDPWAKAMDMASAAGMDLYFDAYGTCVLTPIVNPTTAATVWTYNANQQSILVRVNRKMSNRNTFNDIVVTAEGTGIANPVRVEVVDNDPSSPTYINGPYGKVVAFYTSPLITSTAQATYAAQGYLARSQGQVESLEMETIPHPAHEPGDVVEVTYLPAKIKKHKHALDSVTHPLHHKARTSHRTRRVK